MLRWYRRGRPGMGEFLADPGPELRGHRPPRACLIGGCQYGTYSRGLCARHRRQWDQAGQPGLAACSTGRDTAGLLAAGRLRAAVVLAVA